MYKYDYLTYRIQDGNAVGRWRRSSYTYTYEEGKQVYDPRLGSDPYRDEGVGCKRIAGDRVHAAGYIRPMLQYAARYAHARVVIVVVVVGGSGESSILISRTLISVIKKRERTRCIQV